MSTAPTWRGSPERVSGPRSGCDWPDRKRGGSGVVGAAPAINAVSQESRRRAIESHCRVVAERTIVTPSGEFILEVTNTPLIGLDSTCTHLLTSIWDVTIRRLATRRERELRDQLAHGQKMEALGCLAGGVVNDFNSLLTRIIGYSELAAAKPTSAGDHLGGIQAAAHRAADLVGQILAFSRRQPTDRHPVALASVGREVGDLLRTGLPPGVAGAFAFPPDEIWVAADSSQMHQLASRMPRGELTSGLADAWERETMS